MHSKEKLNPSAAHTSDESNKNASHNNSDNDANFIVEFCVNVRAWWRLLCDPDASWLHKIIIIVAVVYTASPVDFFPDYLVPIFGWADDLGVLTVAQLSLNNALEDYRY